ncbi:YfgC superfamily TPR repeat-containing Zn protease [Candidatus Bealeia paramacronuclearis]|uniref:YfgC superfamily TPR repeat-containing Zn protease n=1 Tax=Candidatus Bealeia paramacronuclearis TaxID=1921001 RepID=A0ABZ2C2Y3_9PROT|nr:YfgC superfamily TPR repeat-containing Zn protease [Candidatus Bealeia paramacronuclearis]
MVRILSLALSLFAFSLQGMADFKEGSLIRDAEIEGILKSYISPIFETAGLNPKDLNLFLVITKEVNASASSNHTIFINTGIILKMKNASQLIGVLAHETSHISGGHVVRFQKVMDNASLEHIIAMVLGGAAAAASGKPEAGMAVFLGGSHFALANLFRYSQGQEGAADQGAIRILEKLGWSSKGLEEFLSVLMEKEIFAESRQDGYMRTHPLSRDRVESIKNHIAQSQYSKSSLPPGFDEKFTLMQTKLRAFIEPVGRVLLNNKESSIDPLVHYARAIAQYRRADHDLALKEIEGLIAQSSENPFYWELKGQILFDSGNIKEAERAYARAVDLAPQEPLLRLLWAQTLIESNDPQNFEKAQTELLRSKTDEKTNPLTWQLLAVVYGKSNQLGLLALSLAEKHFLTGQLKEAIQQAKRSQQTLKKDSIEYVRAQEILDQAQEIEKKSK